MEEKSPDVASAVSRTRVFKTAEEKAHRGPLSCHSRSSLYLDRLVLSWDSRNTSYSASNLPIGTGSASNFNPSASHRAWEMAGIHTCLLSRYI